MRRFLSTAAALALGTSALAWTPASADAQADNAKFQSATYESAASALSAMTAAAGAAEMASWDAAGKLATKDKFAAKDAVKPGLAWLDLDKPAGSGMVEMASWKSTDGVDMAGKTDVAMGGPYEPLDANVVAEGYPPCNPGPGDDRCIQLYERGVPERVAQWKQDADLGMGGPYEPAAAGDKPAADEQPVDHGAMGHGPAAGAAGAKPAETAPADKPAAPAEPPAGTAAAKPSGVGGPFVTATDYPPCRPGPGDDRCIQLYERGVAARRR